MNRGGGGVGPDKIQTSHLVQIYRYPFLLSSEKYASPPVGLLCLPANVLVTCCCGLVSSRHLSEVPEEGESGNTKLESKSESGKWCLPFWAAAKLLDCLAVSQKMCHLSAKGGSCGLYVDFSFCNLRMWL